jgi:hypothetical protein
VLAVALELLAPQNFVVGNWNFKSGADYMPVFLKYNKRCSIYKLNRLTQRQPTGGPRTTFGPIPLISSAAKLFLSLLLVSKVSFIFFNPNDLKK